MSESVLPAAIAPRRPAPLRSLAVGAVATAVVAALSAALLAGLNGMRPVEPANPAPVGTESAPPAPTPDPTAPTPDPTPEPEPEPGTGIPLAEVVGVAERSAGAGTVTEVDEDDEGASWAVLVVRDDGTAQTVRIGRDGAVLSGPDEALTWDVVHRRNQRLLAEARVPTAEIAARALETAGGGRLTELTLEERQDASMVWTAEMVESPEGLRAVLLSAIDGEVLTTRPASAPFPNDTSMTLAEAAAIGGDRAGGGTPVSIDRDDEGASWEVVVAAADGSAEVVRIGRDGTVLEGPEVWPTDADEREHHRFLLEEARLTADEIAARALDAAGGGRLTELTLEDTGDASRVWIAEIAGSPEGIRAVYVTAIDGRVLTTRTT